MDFNINNIKLIVGLGNIGKEYTKTRHNVGFMFLDYISDNAQFNEESKLKASLASININKNKIWLAKPTTMMNLCGDAVVLLKNFYKLKNEEILIVHDDLDLAIGNFKIQFAKGPYVHNGVNSVENKLSTEDFFRLRIGVDGRSHEMREHMRGMDYVLGKFNEAEIKILDKVFFEINSGRF